MAGESERTFYSFIVGEEIFVNSINKVGKIVEISDEDIISIEIDAEIRKFSPGEIFNLTKEDC